MRLTSLLLLVAAPALLAQSATVSLVEADTNSFGRETPNQGLNIPRFSVTLPADEILMPLTLQVSEESETQAAASLNDLRELVARTLAPKGRLVPVAPADLTPTFSGKIKSAGSSLFRGGDSQGKEATRASASFHLRVALAANQSPQAHYAETKALLAEMKFGSSARIERGGWTLGFSNPESLRPQLMQQVAKAIDSDLGALGGKTKIHVTGLDKPLAFTVVSDRDLRFTVPVTLTYEIQR